MKNSLIVFVSLILAAADADAYIGPGPGLSMIGPLLALIAGVFLALAAVLTYPIRLFLIKRRNKKNPPPHE